MALAYLRQHDGSNHYKGLLKALLKSALENVAVQASLCRGCVGSEHSSIYRRQAVHLASLPDLCNTFRELLPIRGFAC